VVASQLAGGMIELDMDDDDMLLLAEELDMEELELTFKLELLPLVEGLDMELELLLELLDEELDKELELEELDTELEDDDDELND